MGSQKVQIPSINFSDLDSKQPNGPDWEETRARVFSSLETYGCFDVVYNRVGSELKETLFGSVMPELFGLPSERKLLMNNSNNYLGYLVRSTDMEYQSLRFQDADNPLSMEKFTKMLYPEGNQLLIDTISSYTQHVRSIEQMVERMIFQSLGIEKHCDSHLESLIYGVRLANYGLHDKEAKVSLRGHKDASLVSIVCQNTVEGLEVLTKEDEWIRVVPSPDTFTVMLGESMTVLTNGRLRATVHRVAADQKRYSVILSSVNKEGYLIEAPKELIDGNHPLKYSQFDVYKFIEFATSPEGLKAEDPLKTFYGVVEA